MAGKHKQRLCRICKKRPPWKYKNCPPGVCKRCYHAHVWPERPNALAGQVEMGDIDTRPMVYDGYYGGFVPAEDASFDVATTPEAMVELPWELETPDHPPQVRRRHRTRHRGQPSPDGPTR